MLFYQPTNKKSALSQLILLFIFSNCEQLVLIYTTYCSLECKRKHIILLKKSCLSLSSITLYVLSLHCFSDSQTHRAPWPKISKQNLLHSLPQNTTTITIVSLPLSSTYILTISLSLSLSLSLSSSSTVGVEPMTTIIGNGTQRQSHHWWPSIFLLSLSIFFLIFFWFNLKAPFFLFFWV